MAKELFDQPLIVSPNLPEDDLHVSFGKPGVAGGFNMLWSYFKQVLQGAVDWIDFTPQALPPTYQIGRIFYDSTENTWTAYNDIEGIGLQLGEELRARLVNDTGSTLLNGVAVAVTGAVGASLQVELLDCSNFDSSIRGFGLMTIETINGDPGYAVRYGAVHELNTLGMTPGEIVYGDPEVLGGWTNIRPVAPFYPVRIGVVIIADAVNGVIGVDTLAFNGSDTDINVQGALNGIVTQKQSIDILVDTGVIYFETDNENEPLKDLPFLIDGTRYFLDTTSGTGTSGKARVALTAGTITVPRFNYIYVLESGGVGVLTANTTGFPADSAPVATCSLLDVTSTNSYGALAARRWNNAVDNGGGNGIFQYLSRRLRLEGSKWITGVDQTVTIITNGGALDNLNITTSSGIVYQIHEQTFDAKDGTEYYIVNHPTTPYLRITDLNECIVDANGGSLRANNTRYGLNLMGGQNSGGEVDKVHVLLPTGSYSSDNNAINDVNNFAVTTVPIDIRGTAFRHTRIVVNYSTSASGTITNLLGAGNFQDERGQPLGVGGGGSGSGSAQTNFSDAEFSVFNTADATKILNFLLSGITAGNARTLTIPDKDGTIALLSDISGTGNATISKNNTFAPALIFDVDSKYYNSYSQSGALVISLDSNTNGQGSYIYATIVTDGSPISFPATWKPVKNEYTNNSANYGLVVYFDGVYYQYFLYNIPNSPVIDLTFSLDFNNTKNYPSFALQPSMALNNGSVGTPYSWSVWVRNTSTAAVNMLIHRGNGSSPSPTSEMSLFYNIAGEIICNLYTDNANYISATATEAVTSSWSNIVVVYDGGSSPSGIHIYKDGVLLTTVNTLTGTFTFPVSRAVGAIGNYSSGSVWGVTGQVSSAIELNKALTPSEIVELWNSGELFDYSTASFIDDILTWWKFDGNLIDEIGLIDGVDVGTVLYSTNIPPLQS